ncbi:MAG: secretin N-terminal domain-containing protein [Acidobacteriota bacterium]
MSKRLHRLGMFALVLALVAGCATGSAVRNADRAASKGDWDTAVSFYRQALGRAPSRADLKIKLERATRNAAAEHVRRARQLETQDQLSGALAEYRLAADLDPSASVAVTKSMELERKIRQQAEASRPQGRLDTLRQQAAQGSPIPRLDPRAPVPAMHFTNSSIRDILRTIGELTGINIMYDQGLDASLSRPYSMDIQQQSIEEILLQVLQANALTFKIQNPRTIFVYQDNPQNRQKYEDQYVQTFFLSHANPSDLQTQLNALIGNAAIAVRPAFSPNKDNNSLTVKATAPVLAVISNFVNSMDRPVPEVFIEAEILEVDRSYTKQLGLDLNQWALGLAFSPEVSPAAGTGSIPMANPGAYNLNTISRGVSANDFYLTSPGAMIRLLESNQNTRVLARPSQRGQAGAEIALKLGDQIPIPTTVFQSGAAGGVANIPTTSVQYQSVGVNLVFTPRVTYQDEIILEKLTLEKSGLGANLDVGGQSFPTIVSRQANTTLRLRDGESTMIAGLLRDDDRRTIKSLPGLVNLPVLRSIFGNSDRQIDQTDIVMIITPHIVRGHEMTADDLKPMYVGTQQNVTSGNAPVLISQEALAAAVSGPSGSTVAGGPASSAPSPSPSPVAPGPGPVPGPGPEMAPIVPSTPQGAAPATPRALPIQPVPAPGAAAPTPQRSSGLRITLAPPAAGPEGSLPSGGGPFTMPIQIADAADVATIALSITYDPAIVRAPTVTQGSFMMQGGVMVTFVPSINPSSGRIDIALSRPSARTGASGSGLLAAISFTAGTAGTTEFTVTGVATTPAGQSIPVQFTPARVAVR